MVTHPQIKYCIFDMDGLMLDSETIYTKVTNKVLEPYGKVMTWKEKGAIMGRPAHDAARLLIELLQVPTTPDEMIAQSEAMLEAAFANVQPLPGVLSLVHHLDKHNVPIAIATGSKKANYKIKTSKLGHLFGPFGLNVMCGDDPILGGKGKPDPTIFLEAAKLMGVSSAEDRAKCLVFEDGAPGVRAARAAGMEVVWVPDQELVKLGGWDDLDPSRTLETLEHFKPEEWGLPAY